MALVDYSLSSDEDEDFVDGLTIQDYFDIPQPSPIENDTTANDITAEVLVGTQQPSPTESVLTDDDPTAGELFDIPQPNAPDWTFDPRSNLMIGGNLDDLDHFYRLDEGRQGFSKHFKVHTNEMNLTFRNIDESDDVETLIERVFDKVIGKFRVKGEGKMGATIDHPAMHSPFIIPFRALKEFTGSHILHYIQKLLQSNTDIAIDSSLRIQFVQIPFPTGSGNKKHKYRNNFNQWKDVHSGHGGAFIRIKNYDHLCCARAIVVAKARIEKDPKWNAVRFDESTRNFTQRNRAQELMAKAGLADHQGPCGIPELEKLQAVLTPEYQIKVYSRDDNTNLVFKGPPAKLIIALFLHDHHYDVVTSVPAIFETSYYCHECETPYKHPNSHNCQATCSSCRKSGLCEGEPILCQDCKRYFVGEECFRNHKESKAVKGPKQQKLDMNVCKRIKRCPKCRVQYESRKKHECGTSYCTTCQKNVKREGHQCFMTKSVPKKNPSYKSLIFFDFETEQVRSTTTDSDSSKIYDHRVIACVAQKICTNCRDQPIGKCPSCGENEVRFSGTNTLDEFCHWLFSPANFDSLVLAHNSKGFDSQFILQYLHKQGTEPKILGRGRNILSLQANSVKIIDSLSFLTMALSAIPKAFGIQELKKGFFPHMFTKRENLDYVGPYPDESFYDPGNMKPNQRSEFEKWYSEHKNDIFDMHSELFGYCQSDVNILREGCLKFQDAFRKNTGLDPFDGPITIAQACQVVYRTHFMSENTIGLIPFDGYRRKDKYSLTAIKWLKWLSHQNKINIQHAMNGGEVRIGVYKVDGKNGKTVYEFNGCPFHGCPTCFPDRNQRLPLSQISAGDAYQRTLERREYIRNQGFDVVEMWSCELSRELKVNQEIKEFFQNLNFVEPLKPRDSLYGGRTNATVLHHKVKEGEKIHYVDVCSLYPWVCKYGVFPIGHPQIITENFKSLDQKPYTGLVHCKVLPPRDLLHPVLPVKSDGKLCFPLCDACLREKNLGTCLHTNQERMITGTWVTLELYKAIKLGYTIEEIHEVYHFEKSMEYDLKSTETGLFVGYINSFLKLKAESSGYPKWAKSDEDKLKFIKDYEQREGIILEPDKIQRNEAFRNMAKLMLNSFWGKFAQNENLGHTVYFKKRQEFLKCVSDPAHEISEVRLCGPNLVMVKYSKDEEFIGTSPNKNVIIAAFVTAQARLKLYSYLERLQERVLYMDTDSIIYLTRPHDKFGIETGSFLGDMTNELEDHGCEAYISEFSSAGPKNYGFIVFNPSDYSSHNMIKVKGFSLTSDVSKELTFENLRRKVEVFVKSGFREKNLIIIRKFTRDQDHNVKTVYSRKIYQVVYDKRRVLDDFSTLPYGY